ncbi:MAG: Y-family DNA polymerase [Bacteroidales bacterium]|nr:Y-family DNA polymerase [Bacteroidales bacterium]
MYRLHIDCNSYFASCEVATRPGTAGKPLVVANDNEQGGGVILALTPEAKAIGLKRGIPLFKVRDLLRRENVIICPADHKKYRRISHKIMSEVVAQGIVQDFVQYSVDEFFGTLPLDDPAELRRYIAKVRNLITTTSGITVGCGCSQTNTLAKSATWFAKHYKAFDGICVLPPEKREQALAQLPLQEVWGVGRQAFRKLSALGVVSALDFVHLPQRQVEQLLTTAGLHTYLELQGIEATQLESHDRRKSIMQSHTFATMITSRDELSDEVARFASRCAEQLRRQNSLCRTVTVFLNTNRYRDDLPQYRNDAVAKFDKPTADTPAIATAAVGLLNSMFRPGYQYKRAGVVLSGIVDDKSCQLDLFNAEADERRRRLMAVTDIINSRFGDETVTFGNL